jgi:TRAP transporter TAXI family solute receptor
MRNLKRVKVKLFLFLIMALVFTGLTSSEAQELKSQVEVRTAALMPGTHGYLYPVAIAPVIEKYSGGRIKMSISPTRGAFECLTYMRDKKMDMGFVGPETLFQSWYGKGAWEGKPDHSVRVLWVYTLAVGQIVTLADSPIKTIYDLKGKTISCPEVGSAGAIFTEQIVETSGLNPRKDVKLRMGKTTAGMDALVDKVTDVFSYFAGVPSTLIVSLGTTHNYRLIDIPSEFAEKINKRYYTSGVWAGNHIIPKGTYPKQISDCKSIVMPYLVVVKEDLPKGVVYEIVKIFFERNYDCVANYAPIARTGIEELKMIQGDFAPFHPEALQYYRERGWMK